MAGFAIKVSDDEQVEYDLAFASGIMRDLGAGYDVVRFRNQTTTYSQVRLTFTSAEVGNGSANDSKTLPGQDGLLAVRVQAEGADGQVTGQTARFDDEGISFVSDGTFTFDVRDLNGTQRGDQFSIVRLGTSAADVYNEGTEARNVYINGGRGNDNITGGAGNDFLVGGVGNDRLIGGAGNDSLIGGAGNDFLSGGAGDDVAIFNVDTDGSDIVNLGAGNDIVVVSAIDTRRIRLTFTGSEVGNGVATDSGQLANQDGNLAVRLQAEAGMDVPTGPVSRFDDEGVTFTTATPKTFFDVVDLVTGEETLFRSQAVQLGTSRADVFDHTGETISYYMNGGQGNDRLIGGSGDDTLVGGAGNDRLIGGAGMDTFYGGAGADNISGGLGDDLVIFNGITDAPPFSDIGPDTVNLGAGYDRVELMGMTAAYELYFNASEVGNGNANLTRNPQQLAMRLSTYDRSNAESYGNSYFDDEGIMFSSERGDIFSYDGTYEKRYDGFELGTSGNDTLSHTGNAGVWYLNGGQGDDQLFGSTDGGILRGGEGNDTIYGFGRFTGDKGVDTFVFDAENLPRNGIIDDFEGGVDKIDFSALNITMDNVFIYTGSQSYFVVISDSPDVFTSQYVELTGSPNLSESDFIF
ncbi:hypothetical protein F1C10_11105 [Sphingomonas sp. NBWT7]|uniref:calcium-binding protein n=1 Tax=Sphingomonas sp. NBWT7 TaxID=2596913 RepID=UPI001626BAC2|nr:hypothetical protein [Sphingomonas sp. NBWT7]QNE32439.1 hypothetical protein F1C10_11105 [Sphingomonas sp. NBWT7]